MSKQRVSASVDKEVHEYLSRDHINASGLINDLVENHMQTGGNRKAMLELREQQIKSKIDELEGTLEVKERELAEVQAELAEFRDHTDEVLDEAASALTGIDPDPENQAIKNWAEKADLSPDEFASRLQRRQSGGV